jgi:hypothetical protein
MNQPLKLIILIPTPPRARLTSSLPWRSPHASTFLDWNQAALCETAVSELRGLRNSYTTVSYCIRRSTGFTSVVLTFTLSLELSE